MAPLTQAVPAATSCHTTLPLLQRPNCFSPLQTMAPLLEHVVVEPPPVEGVDATAGVPHPGEDGAVGFAGVGAVTVMSVVEVCAGRGALEAPGAKTPPPLDGTGVGEGLAAAED
jgi:hypothetical protein